ncbi:hypothetical protein [Pseudomonas sp. o96-267]|uniref:hypothetical protein n=1 Tax=Pseudomonas sp. o96-267 TaxID=2479853 RepID=UPI0013155881|nr:hypothetical protein [Pseudomonas sp. o96-267]
MKNSSRRNLAQHSGIDLSVATLEMRGLLWERALLANIGEAEKLREQRPLPHLSV